MKSDRNGPKMSEKYSTLDVLALAVYAYEVNYNRVERNHIVRGKDELETEPNRVIMERLSKDNGVSGFADYLEKAQEIRVYLEQTNLVQTLTNGSPNNFLNKIVELLAVEESIDKRDFGIIAWAPKLFSDLQKKDRVRENVAQFENTSRFVGKVGDRVFIDFTLIEDHYLKNHNCYLVTGHDQDGNLISYWASTSDKVIKSGKIQGRVKLHKVDERRGRAKVTTLNYVKAVK